MVAQDRSIKNDPWRLTPAGTLRWAVPSASGNGTYTVDLHALAHGADYPVVCTCPCRALCWHIKAATLREQLDQAMGNSRRAYAGRDLASLQAEDRRLSRLLAHASAGDHFLRAQLTALGDVIQATTQRAPNAA